MPPRPPLLVRLPRAFALGRRSWAQVLEAALDARVRARVAWRFTLCRDELRFVRALLDRHSQWWCFRTDQQARAGDFALVDMSCPDPARRTVVVLDVKLDAPLRRGGGGAGNQLVAAPTVLSALRRRRVVAHADAPLLLTGDRRALVDRLSGRTSR